MVGLAQQLQCLSRYSQESYNKKTCKVLCDTHQGRDNAPRNCQSADDRRAGSVIISHRAQQGYSRQPKFRRCTLKNDVARQFKQDITNEVKCQASKILVTGHFEVGRETLDTGIGDY